MPGSHAAEGLNFSGRIKQISRNFHICLRQVSESEIAFSDTFGWPAGSVLTGDCIFKSVGKDKARVTARFRITTRISSMTIRGWKNAIRIFLILIPVAWFLYGLLLNSGISESTTLKYVTIASLFLTIGLIYCSLVLWGYSGRIKIFLKNFSEALGVGNEWI